MPGIICGHVARSRIGKSNGGLGGAGLALAGLIVGYFFLALQVIGFGVVVPASRGFLEKATTLNEALQLKNAIGSYFTEYRKYPFRELSESQVYRSDAKLMGILLASDLEAAKTGSNPRRIPFYSGRRATPIGKGRFRSGVLTDADGGGELWDPWADYYYVKIDADGDGQILGPNGEVIKAAVIVWSAGEDGISGNEDDVTTWEAD
ncbi:MAG: DUF4190 domain-containing protein [Verrucomicrobiae bacterium]|nr:DUF4190 domain-containing protein [Verrucomicrobiae bacterium]